jgi:diguanylate cyclase (GGDEF)-like protein
VASSSDPNPDVQALAAEAARRLSAEAATVAASDPFAGVALRVRQALGETLLADSLVAFWASRDPGSSRGEMRYRWDLSHRRSGPRPGYMDAPEAWRAFRPLEQAVLERDPYAFEERLCTPILLTENCALLIEARDAGVAGAGALLDETAPALRRDFARYVQVLDPWEDTFALACLTHHPAVLALAHPVAVAIASCYGAADLDPSGALVGLRFPFHRKPLVSASAYLATGSIALGIDLERASGLIAYITAARRVDGLWGDQEDSPDILATLAAAELLVGVDPAFDVGPTLAALAAMRNERGLWLAMGPEALWLSGRVIALLQRSDRPFAERFRWPYRPGHGNDLKTGLPSFSYFAELAEFVSQVPCLSGAPLELAFIDLIGFRAFNNRFGQQRGDDVLRAFAQALSELSEVRVVRDGGDEFLVIGAPTRPGLARDLEHFRRHWPARFAQQFGTDTTLVAPRIVVGHTIGRHLARARETAGRAITQLKDVPIAEDGVLQELGRF